MALKEMSQSALAEPFGYDLITSRAFAAPSDFLDKTYGISNQHTQWAALAGRLDPEICAHTLIKMKYKNSCFLVDEVKKIEVPHLHEDRHLIWIRRSS
jgi:16S rRNA G527 N7-methylase RsmG